MNKDNQIKKRKGLKDIWNAYMTEGAMYDDYDILFCPTRLIAAPKLIYTWIEALKIHKEMYKKNRNYKIDAFVCFYIFDQYFDGKIKGVWADAKRALKILKHFKGIITPDFSTYQDMPFPEKIRNTYRMRAFGYWCGKNGLEVVNNLRWGTRETWDYCFCGIEKHSIFAIGTVGGSPRYLADRERFEQGLQEAVRRLCPHTIIVYGSANYPCFEKLREQGIRILSYKSATANYYDRRRQENE